MISLGDPAMGVRVAKLASYNDIMLLSYLAPSSRCRVSRNVTGPEAALVLGIARQESEFDPPRSASRGARLDAADAGHGKAGSQHASSHLPGERPHRQSAIQYTTRHGDA